jgi:hypothetical protein
MTIAADKGVASQTPRPFHNHRRNPSIAKDHCPQIMKLKN